MELELKAVPLDDWEEALLDLQDTGEILVTVSPDAELCRMLGVENTDRLTFKLELVAKLATKLAWNMVKGTLKYPTDDYPIQLWSDMGIDDGADNLNYQLLLRDKLEKEGLCEST
tara:strand:- start:1099 stop:1443 length:345 start_codon:yes stop_codon:yes gene_type:complete